MATEYSDILQRLRNNGYIEPSYPDLEAQASTQARSPSDILRDLQNNGFIRSVNADPEQSLPSRGFEAGLKYIAMAGGGAASYAGDVIGSQSLQQWGADVAKQFSDDMAMLHEGVPSFFAPPDGGGESVVGDGFDFDNFVEWAAYNIPNAAGTAIPGVAAAVLGVLASPKLGMAAGAAMGAGLSTLIGIGSVYSEQLEGAREAQAKGLGDGDPDARLTTVLGPLYGGAEYFFGIGAQLARRLMTKQKDELVSALVQKMRDKAAQQRRMAARENILRRVGEDTARGMASEAGAESLQTMFEEMARRHEAGEDYGSILSDDRTWWAVREGAVAGAFGGGALAGAAGAIPDRKPPGVEGQTQLPPDPTSPIPDEMVRQGEDAVRKASQDMSANQVLGEAGLPNLGEAILMDREDGAEAPGTITDVTILPDGGASITVTDDQGFEEYFDAFNPGVNIRRAPTPEEQDAAAEQFNFNAQLDEIIGNALTTLEPSAVQNVIDQQMSARGIELTEQLAPDQHKQFIADIKAGVDRLTKAAAEADKERQKVAEQNEKENAEVAVVSKRYEDMVAKYREDGATDDDVAEAVTDAVERLNTGPVETMGQVSANNRKAFHDIVEMNLKAKAAQRKAAQEAQEEPVADTVTETEPDVQEATADALATEEPPPEEEAAPVRAADERPDFPSLVISATSGEDLVNKITEAGYDRDTLDRYKRYSQMNDAWHEGSEEATKVNFALEAMSREKQADTAPREEAEDYEPPIVDGPPPGTKYTFTKAQINLSRDKGVQTNVTRKEYVDADGNVLGVQYVNEPINRDEDTAQDEFDENEWWSGMESIYDVFTAGNPYETQKEYFDAIASRFKSDDFLSELQDLKAQDNPAEDLLKGVWPDFLRKGRRELARREKAAAKGEEMPASSPEVHIIGTGDVSEGLNIINEITSEKEGKPKKDKPKKGKRQEHEEAMQHLFRQTGTPRRFGTKGNKQWGAFISKKRGRADPQEGELVEVTPKNGDPWIGRIRKIEVEQKGGWIVSYDRMEDENTGQTQGQTQGQETAETVVQQEDEGGQEAGQNEGQNEGKTPEYGSTNTFITKEEADELEQQIADMLAGKQFTGLDPNLIPIATKFAAYHIEAGARKFAAFAKLMIGKFGDAIRPYLKTMYFGARGMDEIKHAHADMEGIEAVEEQFERLDEILKEDDDGETTGRDGARSGEPVDDSGGAALEGVQAGDGQVPATQEAAQEGTPEGGGRGGGDDVRTDRGGDGEVRGEGSGDEGVSVPADREGDAEAPRRPDAVRPTATNYRITTTDADAINRSGNATKIENNVAAIKVLKELKESGEQATREQQAVLVKYVGWGGLPQIFDSDHKHHERLKELLTDEEYAAARASTVNAHYTSPQVIDAMWKAVEHLGFGGGNILEPAVGIGHFIGLVPDLYRTSKWVALDRDIISSEIASYLYPNERVLTKSYEQAKGLPSDYFDLAISNVPFANTKPFDEKYNPNRTLNLHDFFIHKTVQLVRPGGLVAVITSKGTMDKQNTAARSKIAASADFLGAVRLPDDAFKSNAGTQVTTDILFFRRKRPGIPLEDAHDWVESKEMTLRGTDRDGGEAYVNEYFHTDAGKDMMLGEMVMASGRYGNEREATLKGTAENLGERIEQAVKKLPEDIYLEREDTSEQDMLDGLEKDDLDLPQGYIVVRDGKLLQKKKETLVPIKADAKATARLKRLVDLQSLHLALLSSDLAGREDAEQLRKQLNEEYDEFRKKDGSTLTNAIKRSVFKEHPGALRLMSLEVVPKGEKQPVKADIFFKSTLRKAKVVESVNTANDALFASLGRHGRVDLPFMAKLLKQSVDEITNALDGSLIFDDPEAGWVSRDEYLSGDVVTKLDIARDMGKVNYAKELEAVQPERIALDHVKVRMGAAWLPPSVIKDFVASYMNLTDSQAEMLEIINIEATGKWKVSVPYGLSSDTLAQERSVDVRQGGNFYQLLEGMLNGVLVPKFTMKVEDVGTVVLTDQNEQAKTIIKEMIEEWEDWLMRTQDAHDLAENKYNEVMNRTVLRQYDGQHLDFPGMNPDITLRPHQKDAVWRILQRGATYLAHDVGTGKTFTFIAAAMEARRMGLAHKPVLGVLNKTFAQIADDARILYPGINMLVVRSNTKELRLRDMALMATGDWDLVLMTHQTMGPRFMGISPEAEIRHLEFRREEFEEALQAVEGDDERKRETKRIEQQLDDIRARLDELRSGQVDEDVTPLDESGVDMLMVDEAHEFKNVSYATGLERVLKGLNSEGSRRADNMLMLVQETRNREGKIVMGSGTPLTNSLAELYTLSKYMQPDTMRQMRTRHFDNWLGTFTEVGEDYEYNLAGGADESRSYVVVQRIKSIVNAGDLRRTVGEFLDYATAETADLELPKVKDGKTQPVTITPSDEQFAYLEYLVERTERIRKREVKPHIDNMLVIATEGRKMATDLRLVDRTAERNPEGKIPRMVKNAMRIYDETTRFKGTQLIFLDLARSYDTDESGNRVVVFDALNEIRKEFINAGLPEQEIVVLQDAADGQLDDIFEMTRDGEVRILVMSTKKGGTGVNVQDRVAGVHHLDTDWNIAGQIQRTGRGLRQGNKVWSEWGFELEIYNYAVERTIDAFMWDKVNHKARLFKAFMAGDDVGNEIEDLDDAGINPEEMVVLASGSELNRRRFELQTQVDILEREYTMFMRKHRDAQRKMKNAEDHIAQNEGEPERARAAIARLAAVDKLRLRTEADGDAMRDIPVQPVTGEEQQESPAVSEAWKRAVTIARAEWNKKLRDIKNNDASYWWVKAREIEAVVGYIGDRPIMYYEDTQSKEQRLNIPADPQGYWDVAASSSRIQAFQRVSNALHGYMERVDMGLKRNKDAIPVYEKEIKRTSAWPKSQELQDSKKELSEIMAELGVSDDPLVQQINTHADRLKQGSIPVVRLIGNFVKLGMDIGAIKGQGIVDALDAFWENMNWQWQTAKGVDIKASSTKVGEAVDELMTEHWPDLPVAERDDEMRNSVIDAIRDAIIGVHEKNKGTEVPQSTEAQDAAQGEVKEYRSPNPKKRKRAERNEAKIVKSKGHDERAWQVVVEAVRRMSPSTLVTSSVSRKGGKKGFAAGSYDPYNNIIGVLMSVDPLGVVHHEIVHALKALGLFTRAEWDSLVQAAKAGKWIEKHEIKERYPELFTSVGEPTYAAYEEAFAEEFKSWARLQEFRNSRLNNLFRRVVRYFVQLGRALAGKGFRVYDPAIDIFEDILSGRIGRRSPGGKGQMAPTHERGGVRWSKDARDDNAVEFGNEETEEAWKRASEGIRKQKDNPWFRFTKAMKETWRLFRRTNRHLAKNEQNADMHEFLTQLGVAASTGMEKIARHIDNITRYPGTDKPLTRKDMDLLTRRIVLDDFAFDMKEGKSLPFYGNDYEQFKADYDRVVEAMRDRKDLKTLREMRRREVNRLRDEMVKWGMLTKGNSRNDAYYRHQVLEYAMLDEALDNLPSAKKGKLKKPKIFQRKGTELAINARLVEAEYEWMYRAHVGIAALRALSQVEGRYDVMPELRDKIKAENLDNLGRAFEAELRKALKELSGDDSQVDRAIAKHGDDWRAIMDEASFALGEDNLPELMPRLTLWTEAQKNLGRAFSQLRSRIRELAIDETELPEHVRGSFRTLVNQQRDNEGNLDAVQWLQNSDLDDTGLLNGLAGSVFGSISKRNNAMRDILQENYLNPLNLEGAVRKFYGREYRVWRPEKGLRLYMGTTIPQYVVDKALELANAADIGQGVIDTEIMRETMAKVRTQLVAGGHKQAYILPTDIAEQLDNLGDDKIHHALSREATNFNRWMKMWLLINPLSYVNYNLTNLTGDIDGVIAGFGSTLNMKKYVGEAFKELWDVQFNHKKPSEMYELAALLGIFDSGWATSEVRSMQQQIREIMEKGADTTAMAPVRQIWRLLQRTTTIRENWLRYAAFMALRDKMGTIRKELPTATTKQMGMLIGYGASRRKEIDAISDDDMRAARLARELIGDYHNVSVAGDYLRRTWMWFYSWIEINIRRYGNLVGNMYEVARSYKLTENERRAFKALGAELGVKAAGMRMARIGPTMAATMAVRAFFFYVMIRTFNNLFMSGEEEELTPEERRRLHLTLGKVNGKVLYVSTPGSLHDLAQWVRFEDSLALINEIEAGRATWADMLAMVSAAPVDRIVNSITPVVKLPFETASGITTYPRVTDTRRLLLNDRARPWFKTLSIELLYDELIADIPRRSFVEDTVGLIGVRRRDAGESAYNAFVGIAYDYRRRILDMPAVSMSGESERDKLFTKWKMALRYKNTDAVRLARAAMSEAGIRQADLRRSARNKHPMFPIPLKDRRAFMATLSPHEREMLQKAMKFWRETFMKGLAIR